jgi:hypothetical protein
MRHCVAVQSQLLAWRMGIYGELVSAACSRWDAWLWSEGLACNLRTTLMVHPARVVSCWLRNYTIQTIEDVAWARVLPHFWQAFFYIHHNPASLGPLG